MNGDIRTLKAEMEADLATIAAIYAALDRYSGKLDTERDESRRRITCITCTMRLRTSSGAWPRPSEMPSVKIPDGTQTCSDGCAWTSRKCARI